MVMSWFVIEMPELQVSESCNKKSGENPGDEAGVFAPPYDFFRVNCPANLHSIFLSQSLLPARSSFIKPTFFWAFVLAVRISGEAARGSGEDRVRKAFHEAIGWQAKS